MPWLVALLIPIGCGHSSRVQAAAQGSAHSGAAPLEVVWGGWRGPDGLGVSTDSPLPVTWSERGDGIRWKTPLVGDGSSSPIVVGDRVLLTASVRLEDGRLERDVLAFRMSDGAPLFRTAVFTDRRYQAHRRNSNASPTPVSDGTAVYAFFGSVLASIDLDGHLLWRQWVDPEYADFAYYGSGSSPLLYQNLILVFQDSERADSHKDGWLAAYDQDTGVQVWRRQWRETCCSYTTPLLWHREGEDDLVVAHSQSVRAYDPRTGDLLWSHPYDINQFVSSPVAEADVLCTLGGAHDLRGNACFRVSGHRTGTVVEQLWWDGHSVPEDSSPILYDGKLFAVTIQGVMSAYDPPTGRVIWRARLPTHGHHPSLIAGDGKVYALSSLGTVDVVDAEASEFKLLATNDLGESAPSASPAIADGSLLVRTGESLVRIGGG